MKKHLEISSFHICAPKIMIRWCTVPETWCMTDVIVVSHFGLALLPPNSPKNENFEKMKKIPGDIIILHMCTKNYDHLMYGSWDMVRDGCTYFSFWAIFCPYTPITAQKMKILKKWKKTLEMSSFYIHVPKTCDRCNFYFPFEAIFCPFIPLTAQKIKILKNWKKLLEISSFDMCVPKIMIRRCTVPEICCVTDRWTDGKVTYRGGSPT